MSCDVLQSFEEGLQGVTRKVSKKIKPLVRLKTLEKYV